MFTLKNKKLTLRFVGRFDCVNVSFVDLMHIYKGTHFTSFLLILSLLCGHQPSLSTTYYVLLTVPFLCDFCITMSMAGICLSY